MKKGLLYIVLTFLLSVVNVTAGAQSMSNADSIQISLLTCSPGKEVWAQYGHTAIRYYDKESGEDLAINYGIFSLDQTYFIPRFVLGMTDYRMGVQPMDIFLAQYSYEGRGVVEQVLNLSAEDKEIIYKALQENMKPENVVYRYNYFFDNCTTRARDMLANSTSNGKNCLSTSRRRCNVPFYEFINGTTNINGHSSEEDLTTRCEC